MRIFLLIIVYLYLILSYNPKQQYVVNSLYFLWEKAKPILEKHNINYFACAGSLLGARRDGGIIIHDDDIDIGVLDNEMYKLTTKEFISDLEKSNLYIKSIDSPPVMKIFSQELQGKFFIDIFSYSIEYDKIIFTKEKNRRLWPEEYFYTSEFHPLTQYQFGSHTIQGPSNPDGFLERAYGKDWNIPKKSHNHYEEIGI